MKVAMYARVSTKEQKSDLQLDSMKKFCEFKGWDDTKLFLDHGVSGSTESRPALNDMMSQVRAKEFDVVLVWKFDRLGRSTIHLVKTFEEFGNLGVNFVSVSENIDTTTSTGKLVFSIMASLAEFERERLIERVQAGMESAKKRGVHCGRKRTVDYDKVFELREAGESNRSIAKNLGIHEATVRKILKKAG